MKKHLYLVFILFFVGICSAEGQFQADGAVLLPNPVSLTSQLAPVNEYRELAPATDSLVTFYGNTTTSNSPIPQFKPADGIQQLATPQLTSGKSGPEPVVSPVDRIIAIYTGRIRDRYQTYLERSTRYIGLIKQILRNTGVPEDVAYLPLVESGFNPHACSKANAVGQWQFIGETAKRYGLHIDFWRDERKDPVKAAQAASAYLRDLYKQFGSWDLAMAAYNVGENRIQRLVDRENLKGYLDVSQSGNLPDETKKYVPGYLATLRIVANPEAYGFTNLKYESPIDYDEVVIASPATIDEIAKATGSTVREIRDLNPELKQWCTPLNASEYLLRIPKGTVNAFTEKFSNSDVKPGEIVRQYAVQKNDTIKKISKHTGVAEAIIKAMNPGLNMHAGNNVKLPPKNVVVDASQLNTAKSIKNKIKQYAYRKASKRDRHKKVYATKDHVLRHRHSG